MNVIMKTSILKNVMRLITKKLFFFCLSLAFTALISCSQDDANPSSSEEQETVAAESQDNFYFEDSDDIAEEAFISEDAKATGGKIATDPRLTGAILLRVGTVVSGSLRVDFGTGCKDLRGNIRKGIIIIDHIGRWNEAGSEWTITFSG